MVKLEIKTDKFVGTTNGKKLVFDFKTKLFNATNNGMKKVMGTVINEIRDDASKNLKIKRKVILKSFVGKIYATNKMTLPSIHFYSGVPWMGTHSKGAAITGRIFIPFVLKPIGYYKQQELLKQLKSNENLFVDKTGSNAILWAKNTKADSKLLAPFKRVESTARRQRKLSGEKVRTTFKQEERVNLGIMVRSTKLPKRLNFNTIIERNMKNIVKEIENNFKDE